MRKLLTFTVLLAVAPVFGQLNCSTQVMPLKPVSLCSDTTPLCLCGPTGNNCHWDWVCAAERTAAPVFGQGTVTNPLGGLSEAYLRAARLRMEADRLKMEAEAFRSMQNLQNAQAEAVRAKTAAQAEEQANGAPEKTAGAYNGRYWVRFPDTMKTGFIAGFAEAMEMRLAVFSKKEPEKFRFNGSIGELMKALDAYYRRQDDLGMPIWLAMRIVKLERDGASELEIEAAMDEYWRRVTPAK
jgi:hypothetical protein